MGDDGGREEFGLRGDAVLTKIGGIGLEPAAEGSRADTCEKGELGFGVGFHCFRVPFEFSVKHVINHELVINFALWVLR